MGEATVAVAQAPIPVMDRQDVAEVYAVDIAAEGFAPGPQLRRAIRGPEGLPQAFDTPILTMTVRFNRPWDRSAIERSRPQRLPNAAAANATWHFANNIALDRDIATDRAFCSLAPFGRRPLTEIFLAEKGFGRRTDFDPPISRPA